MPEECIIIGCGAQAKYVIDILDLRNKRISRVLDPIGRKVGDRLDVYEIEALDETGLVREFEESREKLHLAVCLSNNEMKGRLFDRFEPVAEFIDAIHPDSTISSRARLDAGLIINATAVIQPYAEIGRGCMIHAGTIIEHDCRIGNYVNLAMGTRLAGGVRICDFTTVFTGAVIGPNVTIGAKAVIGAGSLVLNDIPDGVTAYGSPAKVVHNRLPPV